MQLTSADSEEFLKPMYEALDSGKHLLLRVAPSRCGGLKKEFIIRSRGELESCRESDWDTQAKVTYSFDVQVLWDGVASFETLKMFWDDARLEAMGCYEGNYLYPICEPFEWLKENEGERILILKDVEWEGPYAYVPMEDGTVKPGAY